MFGADVGRVVPEIVAVHIAVVEPHSHVVRVVNALAGTRVHWPAPRDEIAPCRSDGVQNRLFQHRRAGVNIGRERLTIYGHFHALASLVVLE